MRKNLKKAAAVALGLACVFQLAGCSTGKGTEAPKETNAPATTAAKPADASMEADGQEEAPAGDMLWKVEPLPEKTKLVVSYLANSTPGLTTYIAQQKGWLEQCNLDVEMVYFAGGPAQMEASGSWDVGTTGIGGVITGVLNSDIKILGVAARDQGLFQAFFARKDSDIVKDGTGYGTVPEVYGKPDSWKGKDILTAVGTTNNYTLYCTLKSLGLTLDDVNLINMDIASAITAFLAGQGDLAGVQGTMIYDEAYQKADSDYVMVSSDQMLKSGLSVNYVASPSAWENKQEAVSKWLELATMAGEWANANQDEAAQMMTDMYQSDGYDTKIEDNLLTIKENPFTTLEENKQFFTEKDENGELLAKSQIYNPMDGYVEMGNYTEDQLEELKAKDNFIDKVMLDIYDRAK